MNVTKIALRLSWDLFFGNSLTLFANGEGENEKETQQWLSEYDGGRLSPGNNGWLSLDGA